MLISSLLVQGALQHLLQVTCTNMAQMVPRPHLTLVGAHVLTVGVELARALHPVALEFLAIVAHGSHKVPVSADASRQSHTQSAM